MLGLYLNTNALNQMASGDMGSITGLSGGLLRQLGEGDGWRINVNVAGQ
jgi:hypothetical protein